jgi:hypothetical protein
VAKFLSWYTHKTSGFKTSGFKTSGFKTSGFKTSGLQNVRFTKRQVSKRLVSKRQFLNFIYLLNKKYRNFQVKSVSFLLIMVIYGKITSKIENKTQPANMAATEPADFHQPQVQNIYGCFFSTRRFEDLTFCKPDIL